MTWGEHFRVAGKISAGTERKRARPVIGFKLEMEHAEILVQNDPRFTRAPYVGWKLTYHSPCQRREEKSAVEKNRPEISGSLRVTVTSSREATRPKVLVDAGHGSLALRGLLLFLLRPRCAVEISLHLGKEVRTIGIAGKATAAALFYPPCHGAHQLIFRWNTFAEPGVECAALEATAHPDRGPEQCDDAAVFTVARHRFVNALQLADPLPELSPPRSGPPSPAPSARLSSS